MIHLTERASSALRTHEVLVFDWTRITLCCATAGEPTLRLAPLRTVNRAVHHRLPACDCCSRAVVVAHLLAYPLLAQLDITIECRRVLGVRHFISDLAPDIGLRAALGRPSTVLAPSHLACQVHQSLRGGIQ